MPLYKISGYAMTGFNSDIVPSFLAPGFLTHARNVRAASGGISPFGGYSSLYNLPSGKVPHSLFFVDSGTERFWIIMCSNAIYRLESSIIDVTPSNMTSVSNGQLWSSTDLSGIPVINHPGTTPLFMSSSMNKFEPLPFESGKTWKESGQSCDIIVAHKQFLFALGCTDNGKYIPDSVRWSSVADIGGIPQTWDPLDVTNVAGYTQLGGSGGRIIGALPMRDSLVVYRSHGISVIDYIGGTYVWKIRHLNSSVGLMSMNSVVDVTGSHYFMSDADIYKTDGNSIVSIATRRIKKRLTAINRLNYDQSYAVHNRKNSEILFVIPLIDSPYPNVSFIYNYEYDSWFVRDMPINTKAQYGSISNKAKSWDDLDTTWDGFYNSWDDDSNTPFDSNILALSYIGEGESIQGKIISISAIIGTNAEPFDSIIERTDLVLEDLDTATTIQQIYPHCQSANKVLIQVGSQSSPGAPIMWKPAVEFDPNTQRKVDMRTTGVLHAYRISVQDVKSDFFISGIDILYTRAGRR